MGEATVSVLLGPRGAGKSYLLRHLARGFPRVVVLDPLWEHGELAPGAVGVEELSEAVLSGRRGRWRVCASTREEGDDVAAVALALRGGVLVADEADIWLDQNPEEHWVEQIERGRHYGVSLLVATRRPYLLWRAATANAGTLYQFRCWEGRDLAWYRAQAGEEAADLVAALEPFEAVRLDCRTGAVGRFRAPGRIVPAAAESAEPVAREEEPVERDDDDARDETVDEEAEEVEG